MQVYFDTSGFIVTKRELGETRIGTMVVLPDVREEDRVVLDSVEISAEASAAAKLRKAA